ncbi:related to negative acting factor [Fusarium fujikuroi]|nr:related to negative acting factor [Fusarium fujikuroi]SCN82453.1 related to negative acting factor [Fusarium fujikuroi]SCN84399.1 related to negative acting factor [Fusarium fujikuroi]SCO34664.1 related to negative acting factor [Fusarium fujikuroi]SCO49154.1 related to negative acting factor [Fusarium fujikuroi]
MSHRSRGCLRCRQRRVKCDRSHPSCQRCIARNELCVGYRDEGDLMFQHETAKVVLKSQASNPSNSSSSSSSKSPRENYTRRRSVERASESSFSSTTPVNLPAAFPWLKDQPKTESVSKDEQIANMFMEKYVLLPCNESSSPGFLEHLPCLFKEVNIEGRYALRFAVQACAFADLSREQSSEELVQRSLERYGYALSALGQSLAEKNKTPDDYDLMTVVMLDIFEVNTLHNCTHPTKLTLLQTTFMPDSSTTGAHAQGMAHILRLRGHEQFHDPRGWGLFRLAHHRLQKQHLAKQLSPLPESQGWLDKLNDDMASVKLEKDGLAINQVCQQANQLLDSINAGDTEVHHLLDLIDEMLRLDQEATHWRKKPEWNFQTRAREEVLENRESNFWLPESIQLHPDLWMAYEWNYHRTARIILHQKLVACVEKVNTAPPSDSRVIARTTESISTVQSLAGEVLATVPQSFGDIDHLGRWHAGSKTARWQAVGAYLLLWPIKIIKSQSALTTGSQKEDAQKVFERIRECTGIKSSLGVLSEI